MKYWKQKTVAKVWLGIIAAAVLLVGCDPEVKYVDKNVEAELDWTDEIIKVTFDDKSYYVTVKANGLTGSQMQKAKKYIAKAINDAYTESALWDKQTFKDIFGNGVIITVEKTNEYLKSLVSKIRIEKA